MRRLALASRVLFLFFGVAAISAQQQPFRAGVSLVTVDVTVLDKDGKPVPGLSAADFEVKLGGKVQPVRASAFIQAATPADAPPAPPAPNASGGRIIEAPKPVAFAAPKELDIRRTINNQDDAPAAAPAHPAPAAPAAPATPAHQTEQRTFVILIDDLSFSAQGGKKLFAAAQHFVDSVPASSPVGFTTSSGSATVNPTMDRAAVNAGLAKVVGEFMDPRQLRKGDGEKGGKTGMIGMDEAIDIDRGDDSLLMDVIVRECFFGDRNSVRGLTVQQVLASSGDSSGGTNCASDVASEARRTAALMRQTKGRQLGALTSVINAMRTASGIRHLVYITDGMAISREVIDLQPVTRVAAAAGVQFSVVMEDPESISMDAQGRFEPTGGGAPHQTDTNSQRIREDNKLLLNGAQTFTDMVGGIFYKVIGDAGPSFDRILEASSAVYRLGVELPAGTQPGKELSLSVNISRPGLTIRANKTAVFAVENPPAAPASASAKASADSPERPSPSAPANPPSMDDVLKAALNENRALRGVPIRLGAMIRRSTNVEGQIDVSVNVLFPSSVKTPITALVGIVDSNNAMRVNRKVVDNTSNPVQFLFPLAPGNYAIRFGAAAADGALGTIELPVAVKLRTMGAFTASDVLTYYVGDQSQKAMLFSTDEPVVSEKSTYHASIELYPTGPMPSEPPVINWTVVREGETRPVVDEDSEGRVGASFFRSDLELPFDTLAPGTYIVRATLIVGDKPAGTAAATIRKR